MARTVTARTTEPPHYLYRWYDSDGVLREITYRGVEVPGARPMGEIVPQALEGTVIPAPKHGAEINRETVTEANGSTALTYEKGRRLCRVHGWIGYSGIIGSIGWHMEHGDCDKEDNR